MANNKKKPKLSKDNRPTTEIIKIGVDPDSYLKLAPVWRFSDFDWDGPWGLASCSERIDHLKSHIEKHLASFETMTWGEILIASGGRKNGTNSHPISADKFKNEARSRFAGKNIIADTIFSLRLDAGTRIYGIREGNCLRIILFDPFHKDPEKCAYLFSK